MSGARFARIPSSVLGDPRFQRLSAQAKLTLFGVLAAPARSVVPGLIVGGPMMLAEQLGEDLTVTRQALAELQGAGLTLVGELPALIFVPDASSWDPAANPNVVKAWGRGLASVTRTPLFGRIVASVRRGVPVSSWDLLVGECPEAGTSTETHAEPFRNPSRTVSDGFSEGVPTPPPLRSASAPPYSSELTEDGHSKPAPLALVPIEPQPTAEVLLTFPAVGKGAKTWSFTEPQRRELAEAFPSLDVLAEARKALAWINANPSKRKTASGYLRFLTSWLSRANDVGRPGPRQPPPPDVPVGLHFGRRPKGGDDGSAA